MFGEGGDWDHGVSVLLSLLVSIWTKESETKEKLSSNVKATELRNVCMKVKVVLVLN